MTSERDAFDTLVDEVACGLTSGQVDVRVAVLSRIALHASPTATRQWRFALAACAGTLVVALAVALPSLRHRWPSPAATPSSAPQTATPGAEARPAGPSVPAQDPPAATLTQVAEQRHHAPQQQSRWPGASTGPQAAGGGPFDSDLAPIPLLIAPLRSAALDAAPALTLEPLDIETLTIPLLDKGDRR